MLDLPVTGMHCAACAGTVARALQAVPGVARADVDVATETAHLALGPHTPDAPSLARALGAAGYGLGAAELALVVPGLSSAGAARAAEALLRADPGVVEVAVNPASETAQLRILPGMTDAARLLARLAEAGFSASIAAAPDRTGRAADRQADLRALAALGLLAPFLVEMPLHWLGHHGLLPAWLQAALALGVAAIALPTMLRGAVAALRARTGTMDQLVSLGTLSALGLSFWHLAGGGPLYFEAAAAVPALVLAGKRLEARAKRKASDAITALAALRPDTATRLAADGTSAEVPAAILAADDRVLVGAGMSFPADGIVLEGDSAADESLVTGESLPVPKYPGSTVIAGSVNADGALVVRVTQAGDGTVVARILRMVRDAQASRAPMQALADRIAAVFVPAVIGLALITLLGWLAAGAGHAAALVAAISVLVIACPCALGLATPAAIVAGLGAAARQGVLFASAAATERARTLDVIVLDKTGTLTAGHPTVAAVRGAPDTLALAAALSAGAAHPLARGVLAAASGQEVPAARLVMNFPGRGVQGRVGTRRLKFGNAQFVGSSGALAADAAAREAEGASIAFLAEDGIGVIGFVALADPIRPEAAEALAAMRALGVSPVLASGDAPGPVAKVAAELGIAEYHARASPADKAGLVQALRGSGRRVAMLGDGVNDAPGFAVADLSMAMGGGADAAIATADIALLRDDPRLAASAIRIARATATKVRQNLVLAFAYNILAIPLAMAGMLSPAVAGAAMAASSISVVANALSLRRAG